MKTTRFSVGLVLFVLLGAWTCAAGAREVLGIGSTALLDSDLTDPENDGDDSTPAGSNFNAVFDAWSAEEASFAGEHAFNVFDNKVGSLTDKWCCADVSASPLWVQATFPQAIHLRAFTIASGNDGGRFREPDRWRIQGSNDGVNFTDILVYDNDGTSPFTANNQVLLYRVGTDYPLPGAFTTIRYRVESTVGGTLHQLNELEFFDQVPGAVTLTANANCSLHDAILAANTAGPVGGCAAGSPYADQIVLTSDVNLLSADADHSGLLFGARAGLPDISQGVFLSGPGQRIRGNGCGSPFRLLQVVGDGFLQIDGAALENACAPSGGAMLVTDRARLRLVGARISGNRATGNVDSYGGGILVVPGTQDDTPALMIESTMFNSNEVASGINADVGAGGAVAVLLSAQLIHVRDSRFESNQVLPVFARPSIAAAGAIYSVNPIAELLRTRFAYNLVVSGPSAAGEGGDALGGALVADVLQMRTVYFEGNIAQGDQAMTTGVGGDAGAGAWFGSVQNASNVAFLFNEATGGTGATGGAAKGGAWLMAGVSGQLSNMSFVDNRADGGNVSGAGNGGAGQGGALYSAEAIAHMRNFTFADNVATGGRNASNVRAVARGGAWYQQIGAVRASHLTVIDNHTLGANPGRGVNSAGAGLALLGSVQIDNSVLARNDARLQSGGPATQDDCTGSVSSLGFNRVQTPGQCPFQSSNDVTGGTPAPLPIAANGCLELLPGDAGCLLTAAPQQSSPLIDKGSCAVSGASSDARGMPRPRDILGISNAADSCDIGAFEASDGDSDGAIDGFDNCPGLANPTQADADMDGIGDACDACFSAYAPTTTQSLQVNIMAASANGSLLIDLEANNGQAADVGLTYAISGGNGAPLFSINPSNGRISLSDSAALGAVGQTYALEISVSDCDESSSLTVQVTVVGTAVFANGFE